MSINDPRDEAILALAAAVQHLSIDAKSREFAERAEALIRGAKLIEQFVAARDEITAEIARLKGLRDAHELAKKHMPAKVSNFGSGDGVFGWTGIDAAGNRVTWKVEPPAAAVAVGEGDAPKSPAKSGPVIAALKIEVDDSQVRAALQLVESLSIAVGDAEEGVAKAAASAERMALLKVVADAIGHAQRTAGDASKAAKEAAAAHTGALRM